MAEQVSEQLQNGNKEGKSSDPRGMPMCAGTGGVGAAEIVPSLRGGYGWPTGVFSLNASCFSACEYSYATAYTTTQKYRVGKIGNVFKVSPAHQG